MIPKGWKVSKLQDGITLLSGQHILADDYTEEPIGVPYLTGPADFPNGKIAITKYAVEPKVICQAGDLLLTVKGSGTGQVIKADQVYCISRQLMAIRPHAWNGDFIYYILETYQEKYSSNAAGLIPGITREDVLNTSLLIPPLPEQRAIAAILSTWDEAITLTERLIEALRQRKQALMQLLLTGEVRFPEFEGEWEKTYIGSCLNESHIPSSSELRGKKITVKWYGKGVIPKEDSRLSGENTQYFVRKAGQFIYSKIDFLRGAMGIIPFEMNGYESTTDLPAFDIDASLNAVFFLNYVLRKAFYKRFLGSARGSRKSARIPPSALLETAMYLPEIDEQNKISDALGAVDEHITLCGQLFEHLHTQKRALMQQLLTGAIRVQVEE